MFHSIIIISSKNCDSKMSIYMCVSTYVCMFVRPKRY